MNIREKILVIEDEKSIARFISTILTANGYEAMRAALKASGGTCSAPTLWATKAVPQMKAVRTA